LFVTLGTPAGVTAGFQPALSACVAFAVLAAVTALGIGRGRRKPTAELAEAELAIAA
jgi:hypothetical protein